MNAGNRPELSSADLRGPLSPKEERLAQIFWDWWAVHHDAVINDYCVSFSELAEKFIADFDQSKWRDRL